MIALTFKHNQNIIKLLINDKTNYNHKNIAGNNSLMIALRYNHDENIIKSFINNKTDINQKNKNGYTL